MTTTHLIGYCDHCGHPVAAEGVTLTGDDAMPREGARAHRCDDTACVVTVVTECAYCGRDHQAPEAVPAIDDDATWAAMAADHADDCEWITTRAHRHL